MNEANTKQGDETMMQRNRIGRDYDRALRLAMAHGVDFDTDFHAQSFGPWLSELARQFGYRAPKNGSSSTGRHFFYLLKRLHDKQG